MKKNQRGDTLVEVLIAITVLGIVVAGVMATMNSSLVSILNSAERTASRADINTQTDLLNYVFNNDPTTWNQVINLAYAGGSDGSAPAEATDVCRLNPDGDASANRPGSFYLKADLEIDESTISGVKLETNLNENNNGTNQFQRAIPGRGLWVDAVFYEQSATNRRSYFDFYIKACWVPLGNISTENSRSITVTRIYDYTLDDDWTPPTPPTPPAHPAPTMRPPTFNNATNTITFEWSARTCPAGTTAKYQYRRNGGAWEDTNLTNMKWDISGLGYGDYTLQVRSGCGSGLPDSGIGSSTYQHIAPAAPAAPAAPTVNSTPPNSSLPLTFTWTAATCPAGTTAEYQYRENGGAWSSTTSTSHTWTSTAPFGADYTLEVQARCNHPDVSGEWSDSGSKTHRRPSQTTAGTLTVSNTKNANSIAWQWSGVSCAKGSLQYQYRFKAGTGSWTSWTTTTGTTTNQSTSGTTGFTYGISVQARCYIDNDYGDWRPTPVTAKSVTVIPQGYYSILQSVNTGYAIAVPSGQVGNGKALALYSHNSTWTDQQFRISPVTTTNASSYFITTRLDSGYHVQGGGGYQYMKETLPGGGATPIELYQSSANAECDFRWEFTLMSGSDTFEIMASCTHDDAGLGRRYVIDNSGNRISDMNPIVLYHSYRHSGEGDNQAQWWKLVSR